MRRAALGLLIVPFLVLPALADRIDGEWCTPGGKHYSIKGPAITLPGGHEMTGEYSRHAFRFTAPQGAEDAGAEIYLDLLNDDELNRYVVENGAPSAPVLWRRCEVTS